MKNDPRSYDRNFYNCIKKSESVANCLPLVLRPGQPGLCAGLSPYSMHHARVTHSQKLLINDHKTTVRWEVEEGKWVTYVRHFSLQMSTF